MAGRGEGRRNGRVDGVESLRTDDITSPAPEERKAYESKPESKERLPAFPALVAAGAGLRHIQPSTTGTATCNRETHTHVLPLHKVASETHGGHLRGQRYRKARTARATRKTGQNEGSVRGTNRRYCEVLTFSQYRRLVPLTEPSFCP